MLTDTAIKKAKADTKRYKPPDDRGLHLLVRVNGSKLWQLRYRHDGKEKTASLGQYPDVGLSAARQKRDDMRKLVAGGTDPVAAKRAAKVAKAASAVNTFDTVARAWHKHWKEARSSNHVAQVFRRFEADVFPAIGSRPIDEIEAPELVGVAKTIAQRGAIDVATRALQTCSQVFRYAIAHGKARRNPATDIKPSDVLPQRKATNYARVDSPKLPALLRKIEGYQGTPTTRLAMTLMALTFVRTGELIGAKWAEFDLDSARWDIPAARMKMRTPHIVPLSSQAIDDGDFVVVDKSIKPCHGHVVVAVGHDEFTIKKLYKRGGRIKLQAANPTYPDIVPSEELVIWGVARHCIKALPT